MTEHEPIKARIIRYLLQKREEKQSSVLSETKGNKFYITFNRPKRYNAFFHDMYFTFTNLIQYANQNAQIKYIIISGAGGNFTSGNDLQNFTNTKIAQFGTLEEIARCNAEYLFDLTETIIKSKKPIFAITEGKVIGFGFTQLALYDKVFSVTTSEFNAPLVKLFQGPQMCSSYTFPKIFGKSVGEDLIINGSKVGTAFLEKYGFLQSYKSRVEADAALNKHLDALDMLEWSSYVKCRQLFRDIDRKNLLKVNRKQVDNLAERWSNPELPILLMQYMAKMKSKSKL